MGEATKIEWADHTMNFWLGCTKVSAACDHCYAEALMDHRLDRVTWGNAPRVRTSPTNWRQPYRWDRAAKAAGIRRRVFTLSLGDFFDNQVDEAWRQEAWGIIADCHNLDWLILTKRPQNILKMLPSPTAETMVVGKGWPWPHVWLGTTAENQEEFDRRWPHLRDVPAAIRFLSMDPLLGPIFFRPDKPDWIIVGGESGSGARPMHPAWAHSLRDQCQVAGVPFFFKQWGEWAHLPEGDDPAFYPDNQLHFVPEAGNWMRRVGKRAAGRLLDGREWSEFPC